MATGTSKVYNKNNRHKSQYGMTSGRLMIPLQLHGIKCGLTWYHLSQLLQIKFCKSS